MERKPIIAAHDAEVYTKKVSRIIKAGIASIIIGLIYLGSAHNQIPTGKTHCFSDGQCVAAHRHINPDGSLGGWIANSANVEGTVTIGPKATVFGLASVEGRAMVTGYGEVCDNAKVSELAQIKGRSRVSEAAHVFGRAIIDGEDTSIGGKAQVYGRAKIKNAWVKGMACIFGAAEVTSAVTVADHACVFGNEKIVRDLYDCIILPAEAHEAQKNLCPQLKEYLDQLERPDDRQKTLDTWGTDDD